MKLKVNKTVVTLSLCALALLIAGGISYAYFTASVIGNSEAKGVNVESGTMSLKLDGTKITSLNGALPGAEHTINFSVENTGTLEATYSLDMISVTNNFVDQSDLVYSITSTNNGRQKQTTLAPSSNQTILSGVKIAADEKQEYSLTLHFKETGDNQNDNQGKAFSGLIQLNATNNIILPIEYQKIEYLETTGTQYIDTGYKPTNNTMVESQFLMTSYGGFLYGSRDVLSSSDAHAFIQTGANACYSMLGTSQSSVNYNLPLNQKVTLNNSAAGAYIDNRLIKSYPNSSFSSTNSLHIFALKETAGVDSRKFKGYLYNFAILENKIIKHYFVAAKRKSDSVLGLYDIINNKLYTNIGTSTFKAGPEIS